MSMAMEYFSVVRLWFFFFFSLSFNHEWSEHTPEDRFWVFEIKNRRLFTGSVRFSALTLYVTRVYVFCLLISETRLLPAAVERGFLNARVFIIIISFFCLKMNERSTTGSWGRRGEKKTRPNIVKPKKAILCVRDWFCYVMPLLLMLSRHWLIFFFSPPSSSSSSSSFLPIQWFVQLLSIRSIVSILYTRRGTCNILTHTLILNPIGPGK